LFHLQIKINEKRRKTLSSSVIRQEEREKDVIQRILFLTVPSILGSIARWGYDAIDTYDNDEGIWDVF